MIRNVTLFAAVGVAAVGMGGLGLSFVWRSVDQARLEEGRQSNCEQIEELKSIQRTALSESIASSRKFLREHPEGIPGITPELIQEGIDRNVRTKHSLAQREC